MILVTGGAGYIGSHTVERLLKKNHDVMVIDNLVFGHEKAVDTKRVKFIKGDIGDRILLKEIFTQYNIEAVMHFAAYTYVGESMTEPAKYYQNNLVNPLALIETMLAHNCKKFIFSSTCATYGNPEYTPIDEKHPQNPINPYGKSKYLLEQILLDFDRAYDLKSVFLRYFNASGAIENGKIGEDHNPETHLIPLIFEAALDERDSIHVFGSDYSTPDGTCIRDYIHVNDLADAHIAALNYLNDENKSVACNLGTGNGYSVMEVINAVEEVTGMEVPVKMTGRREGDPAELVADPARAKEILGWKANYTDIHDIIRSAWSWKTGPHKGKFES